MEKMAGKRLVQHSITSRPTVTTLQLGIGDNLPNSKGIGGLEDTKTDLLKLQPLGVFKGTGHVAPLHLRCLKSLAPTLPF